MKSNKKLWPSDWCATDRRWCYHITRQMLPIDENVPAYIHRGMAKRNGKVSCNGSMKWTSSSFELVYFNRIFMYSRSQRNAYFCRPFSVAFYNCVWIDSGNFLYKMSCMIHKQCQCLGTNMTSFPSSFTVKMDFFSCVRLFERCIYSWLIQCRRICILCKCVYGATKTADSLFYVLETSLANVEK